MQYRELGKTGQRLSVIGFGGMVVVGHEQSEANQLVAEAVERGINYFDVAPTYADGEAEMKLGPALEPFRSGAFLACKTTQRDAAGAQAELDRSLQRARTDHFDLYQLHAVSSLAEVEHITAPGGALEVFVRAREAGKARFLGFSAHSAESAVELLRRFPFDSVLLPLNFAAWEAGFGPQVVEAAKATGTGLLALKGMALRRWVPGTPREGRPYPKCWYEPIADRHLAELALNFTLSLPITAAVPPSDARLWRMAIEVAGEPRQLSEEELAELKGLGAAETAAIFDQQPGSGR